MAANEDARMARKVQREWDKWIDDRIAEMESDLDHLLARVERLKANLEAAKWVRKTQRSKR